MTEKFIHKTFRPASLELIATMNGIIDGYRAQGYELTLRQLYYQLVARDAIPNTERSYKNIGNLVSDARLAGLIDWNAIVDRTRYVRQAAHFTDESDVLEAAANSHRLDKWILQPNYVEVWIEKDALISIVEKAARALDVPCFSCRGYTSQSEMYEAAQRFKAQGHRDGRYIIHLGDHDPSGLDMTRDLSDRLALFGAHVTVKRIALNMDQIEALRPPPNPAKLTDARAKGYIRKYGPASWELDALDPATLEGIIEDEVIALMDTTEFFRARDEEQRQKNDLDQLAKLASQYGAGRLLQTLQTSL